MVPNQSTHTSLIVAFVADLMMATRIENVVRHLEYAVTFIGESPTRDSAGPESKVARPGEPVSGPEAILMQQLTKWQPALLIFDLGNEAVDWRRWIAIINAVPATRHMPMLAFGPHVDVAAMTQAKKLGAEAVVARSRFTSAMPELIEKHILIPDYAAMRLACKDPLSELAIKGLDAFNQGSYFDSHEYLEDAWIEGSSPARELYRAVLQVAVAYLQIERDNYNGAVKMFMRARHWLELLPDTCRGIDVARLKIDAETVHQAVLELGRERLAEFDRSLFRPVHFINDN